MNVMHFLVSVCSHCIIVSVLEMFSVYGVLVSGLHQQNNMHIYRSTVCVGLTFCNMSCLILESETIHLY